jgi:hypothetical protein
LVFFLLQEDLPQHQLLLARKLDTSILLPMMDLHLQGSSAVLMQTLEQMTTQAA